MKLQDYFEKQKNRSYKNLLSTGLYHSAMDGINNFLENAQLLLYKNAFEAIIATLEARNKYTRHHSERVSIMCERFCNVLKLMPWQVQIIEVTATVHDIGKVGVSD